MIEFCPECGGLLRKNRCRCGYNAPTIAKKIISKDGVIQIWNPPSPNIIYCKITGTPLEKLKKRLNKGIYPEKLKEIKKKLKEHLYTCCNCVYYKEDVLHCQYKNKFLKKDSICRSFEPYENII
ncbi:unnamed protein product [marine sediment metagenome]|uniref:Uncharacterized protein n=1 Tax=marine sediment metagenome TaxID=412755 RepID=X1PQR2_9ZZZZ